MGAVGVEISAFPLTWHIAYTTACCYRTIRDTEDQNNSASSPPWDGKWVVAYGLQGEGRVWLIEATVCLLAANCGSNCSFTRAVDGRI